MLIWYWISRTQRSFFFYLLFLRNKCVSSMVIFLKTTMMLISSKVGRPREVSMPLFS